MRPEDQELWRQVTEGIIPIVFTPTAAVIRPTAPLVARHRPFRQTLDLHGLTLNEAHAQTKKVVYEARLFYGLKSITVITGLSGQIRREFPFWVEALPEVRRFEPLNGGGAFRVHLKKRP